MKKPSTRRPTNGHWWFPLDIDAWNRNHHYLHACQHGILLLLCIWQADADAGRRAPIPNKRQTIARVLNLYSKTELAMLREVLDNHTSRTPNGTLCVHYMADVLARRRAVSAKRREIGRKGGKAKALAIAKQLLSKSVANTYTATATATATERERGKRASARRLALSERGSLLATLTESQKAELKRKGIDPADFCRRFEEHYADGVATEATWARRTEEWIAREKPALGTVRVPLSVLTARSPEQLAEAERLARQAEEAKARFLNGPTPQERLAAMKARERKE